MFEFTLLGFGYVALGIALTLDVLLNKHRPVSAVLWLALVWAVPYAGAQTRASQRTAPWPT
jgi:hypothetical protein